MLIVAEKIFSLIICCCANFRRANFEREPRLQSPSLLEVKKFSLRKPSALVCGLFYCSVMNQQSCVCVKTKILNFIADHVRIKRFFDFIFSRIVIERHRYQNSLEVEMTKKV